MNSFTTSHFFLLPIVLIFSSRHWNNRINSIQGKFFGNLETFFDGAYSNLTSFFIGQEILDHFNDFYNWHF